MEIQEFQQKIHAHLLATNGSLKAQLRCHLIQQLVLPKNNNLNLSAKALDSLIADYLKSNGRDFTLSILNHHDIMHALNLNMHRIIQNPSENSCLLDQLLSRDLKRITREQDAQTDFDPSEINVKHFIKESCFSTNDDLQSRFESYQNQLESSLRKQMQNELSRYKSLELAKIKEEERQFQSKVVSEMKSDFEKKELEFKHQIVLIEEKEAKRFSIKETELERSNIILKQSIMDERNQIILKEAMLKNEMELKLKQLELERDLMTSKYKECIFKIEELSSFKEKYSCQVQESMSQYKIDLNREHASLISSVEIEKTRLEGERAKLNERSAVIEQMMNNVKHAQQDIDIVRNRLRETQSELVTAVKDRDEAQLYTKELELKLLTNKGSAALEFEVQSLKRDTKIARDSQTEQNNLLKQLVSNQSSENEKNKKDAVKWKRECEDLARRLDYQITINENLKDKYNQEALKVKQLKRDNADLKVLVHQTRNALTHEIALQSTFEPNVRHNRTDLLPNPLDMRYEEHSRISNMKMEQSFLKFSNHEKINHSRKNSQEVEDPGNNNNVLYDLDKIDLKCISPFPETNELNLDCSLPHIEINPAVQAWTDPLVAECPIKVNTHEHVMEPFIHEIEHVQEEIPIENNAAFVKVDEPENIQDENALETQIMEAKKQAKRELLEREAQIQRELDMSKMAEIENLEKDPILEKYINIVRETRKANETISADVSRNEVDKRFDSFVQKLESSSVLSNGSGVNFGEGDTDSFSVPSADMNEFKW